MRVITISVILCFFLAGQITHVQAQLPDGTVQVTIEKTGQKTRTYTFPDINKGAVYSAMQQQDADASYIDISSIYSFPAPGGQDDLQLVLRIEPAGTGAFSIPLADKDIPKRRLALNIVYTPGSGSSGAKTFNIGGESEEGVSGSAVIEHYGQPGDYISGHFDATLKDMGENHSGLYHVTGHFKIIRTE